MLPYDSEVLFSVFAHYNRAAFPAQLIAYALSLAVVALAFRSYRFGARFTGFALAAQWAWVGAAWHLTHFAAINFAAPLYGGLFIAEAALFIWTGGLRGRLSLRAPSLNVKRGVDFRDDVTGWVGLALIAYALIDYPLIFGFLGHGWGAVPLVGMAPVPTTFFTLGVLLLVEGRTPWHLLAIPLAWSLIDGWTAWALDTFEDLVLPAGAIVTVGLVVWRRGRRLKSEHASG